MTKRTQPKPPPTLQIAEKNLEEHSTSQQAWNLQEERDGVNRRKYNESGSLLDVCMCVCECVLCVCECAVSQDPEGRTDLIEADYLNKQK